jgi:hypothetical protein
LPEETSAGYDPLILALTLLNVLLVALPSAWIAMMQTRMIMASMTAYSTAVGPSSETRKRLILSAMGRMISPRTQKALARWEFAVMKAYAGWRRRQESGWPDGYGFCGRGPTRSHISEMPAACCGISRIGMESVDDGNLFPN